MRSDIRSKRTKVEKRKVSFLTTQRHAHDARRTRFPIHPISINHSQVSYSQEPPSPQLLINEKPPFTRGDNGEKEDRDIKLHGNVLHTYSVHRQQIFFAVVQFSSSPDGCLNTPLQSLVEDSTATLLRSLRALMQMLRNIQDSSDMLVREFLILALAASK